MKNVWIIFCEGENFAPFYLQASDTSSLKENLEKKLNFSMCSNGRPGLIEKGNKISMSNNMDSEEKSLIKYLCFCPS